jgi:hypothetical protein
MMGGQLTAPSRPAPLAPHDWPPPMRSAAHCPASVRGAHIPSAATLCSSIAATPPSPATAHAACSRRSAAAAAAYLSTPISPAAACRGAAPRRSAESTSSASGAY